MSNVSVTNEIVAARRLFPLRQINFDAREKTFCVHRFTKRRILTGRPIADGPPRMTAPRPRAAGDAQRLGRKLLHLYLGLRAVVAPCTQTKAL
jgi:hypothetical protein